MPRLLHRRRERGPVSDPVVVASGAPATLLDSLFTEYWLASSYSGSGSWLGEKGVADLALPGGSANPTWLPHSTSQNLFGAGVDYVAFPGTVNNGVATASASLPASNLDWTLIGRVYATDYTTGAHQTVVGHAESGTTGPMLSVNQTGGLSFWAHGSSLIGSTIAMGATDGTVRWVKGEYRDSDRRVQFFTGTTATNDWSAVSWTQLGTDVTLLDDPPTNAASWRVAGYGAASTPFGGGIAVGVAGSGLQSAGAMTVVADFNPSVGTFNDALTTLTLTGDGRTWTLASSTTGRRTAPTIRDGWWLGTDDYLSTPDNPLFDFGASQDFTLATLFRSIQDADSDSHHFLSKRDTATSTEAWSYGVQGSGAAAECNLLVRSAGVSVLCADTTWNNPGQVQTLIGTRTNGATGTLSVYTDAVSVGDAQVAPGDTTNALVVNVGRYQSSGTGASFYEGLIYGLGISRTGLTAAQVVQLDAELRGLA